MQSIDIIGGSGFIGTRLVNRLRAKENFSIQIIDKAPSKTHPNLVLSTDVRSVEQLRSAISRESVIINLAAEHRDDVKPLSLYHEVNVRGAHNICDVASEKGVKTIIFTSTVAVYGFTPIGTDESGAIAPFNEYGHSKYQAELIFKAWQNQAPKERTLVIIRPTVIFGEQNRGNVYNLLSKIATGKFIMVGNGKNRKSIAYVENVAAFIEYAINFKPGTHIYNFTDKPDFSMNDFVKKVKLILGRSEKIYFRVPVTIGLLIAKCFDLLSILIGRRFTISSIRVKKFCADSVYSTTVNETGFVSPVPLEQALKNIVKYEFMESHKSDNIFYTE